MFQHLNLFLILILITSGPIEARRSSSGGGFSSRGASSSRSGVANGGGFNGQSNSGFNSNQGSFHPTSNVKPNTNFNNQGGFHPNSNVNNHGGFHPNTNGGFRTGTGLGSSASSGTFKKALIGGALGAAGGILAYEAGKAIIKSATAPFNYNNREYHWDNHGQVRNGEFQCSMPLSQLTAQNSASTTTTTTVSPESSTSPVSTTPSPDQVLQNIQYQDGSRPKTIVWSCKVGREQCCGTDCCPLPPQNQSSGGGGASGSNSAATIALIVLIILLLTCCCCCVGAYFCCRSVFDCFGGNKNDNQYEANYDQQYQMQNYEQPQAQPGYYPQQQYGSNYPQSGNYYPPNHYPAQPTY